VAGCGGAGASRATESTSAQTEAQDSLPPSDRGLAMWARADPPPFPVDEFVLVASPVNAHLPPDRLARIAAFIRWYERDPFDPQINRWGVGPVSTRAAILLWVTASPDVHVIVSVFLEPMAAMAGENAEAVVRHTTLGSMMGMAAHAIEHPEEDPRGPVRQAAGVASGLRWYEAALRRGAPRSAFLDNLIAIRDGGGLEAWFSAHVHIDE